MKRVLIIFSIIVLFCTAVTLIFIGLGSFLSMFFASITLFQATLLLLIPLCVLFIVIPLLLINNKMEQMIIMTDDDYGFWEDEDFVFKRINAEKKHGKIKKDQKKIIVMNSSPIIDKNALCPCGSGEKYKNCCSQEGKK